MENVGINTWESSITEDISMLCNCNFNTVIVFNKANNAKETHQYPEGIMTDDIESLRNNILISLSSI